MGCWFSHRTYIIHKATQHPLIEIIIHVILCHVVCGPASAKPPLWKNISKITVTETTTAMLIIMMTMMIMVMITFRNCDGSTYNDYLIVKTTVGYGLGDGGC